MVVFLLFINIKLAIYSMGSIALIYFVISTSVNSKLILNSKVISDLQNRSLSIISSSIYNIKSLIINQSSGVFQKEFKLIDFNRRMTMAKNNVIGIVPKYLVESLSLIAILLILLYQSKIESNTNSIPFIASILFAFQKMLPMVQTVYQSWTQIKGSDGVIKDVIDALDIDVINSSAPLNYNDSTEACTFNNIRLKDVSFKYGHNEPKVLNKINFEISQGVKIAIIGNSGAGKTTLIEVLLSLLNCTDGEILWDGIPISQYNMYKYRSLFSYVSQDVFLIEDTLEKNIAFTLNEKSIDYTQLLNSISKSNLQDFVNDLPIKEKTVIGKLRMLSGGQKQRIGIARALYHNSKILILDESTSNLDPKTEFEIVQSLTQNNPDLTILMITHKYDNLNLFDYTYKMENGEISSVNINK
jgi:ABC-type multidrug transport system fused ATPase/permease subunit